MRRFLILAGLCSVALVGVGPAAPLPKTDPRTGLSDSFDGKLSLDWKVVRPDPTHVSLKKVPGALVITTQRGSIHGKESEDQLSGGLRAKNIHLIDNPLARDDWVATTSVKDFLPDTSYQQAGLIVYDDDDNYLKWTYEFNWRKGEGQTFHVVAETDGVPVHHQPEESGSGLKKFRLKLTKRGDKYEYAWSADGEKWVVAGERTWGDGHPKRVGLIAKNGGNKDAAELDAAFEFFDLRPAPAPAKK
jgi:regulation of enolase protein 1 (concanavalin A-like superfamily)